jgi:predicted DNA-binding protein with PD1-like motif
MKYSKAEPGRVFVIRLEDGDILHESIERFAREQKITAAALIVLGGADVGSKLVVGPETDRGKPIVPMEYLLPAAHEVTGTGTLFPDPEGVPELHMHISAGRMGESKTGCVRRGVKVWHVMEVVVFELVGSTGRRLLDPESGFQLLVP